MNKFSKFVALLVLAALFLAITPCHFQMISAAESTNGIRLSSGTRVYSPVNVTYNTRFLDLNLTFPQGMGVDTTLTYSIDGKYMGKVPLTALKPDELHVVSPYAGFVSLPELSEGKHNLTINVLAQVSSNGPNPPGAPFKPTTPNGTLYQATWEDTIFFSIDTNAEPPDLISPTIAILSIDNKTFATNSVPLEFIVDEPISHATYNLNQTGEVTIQGNTTLNDLQSGTYFLVLNVWDTTGNLETERIQFSVAEDAAADSTSDDFPTLTIIIVVSTVVVCLLVADLVLKRNKPIVPEQNLQRW